MICHLQFHLAGGVLMNKLFEVIYEDAELLVINKPAGLVCHPTKTDAYSSLISRVRLYLGGRGTGDPHHEPLASGAGVPPAAGASRPGIRRGRDARADSRDGCPTSDPSRVTASICAQRMVETAREVGQATNTPHLINRLDRETSGVVLVAKQDAVARDLRRIWERHAVRKEYLAIVHGRVRLDAGVIDAPLGKDDNSSVAIKDCVRSDGAASQTEFRVERRFRRAAGEFTLVRVLPRTGRKHQIRIHLAHLGHPIVGDKLYGDEEDLYLDFVKGRLTEEQRRRLILPNQALHAGAVRFFWRDKQWVFQAEPEGWFAEFAGLKA